MECIFLCSTVLISHQEYEYNYNKKCRYHSQISINFYILSYTRMCVFGITATSENFFAIQRKNTNVDPRLNAVKHSFRTLHCAGCAHLCPRLRQAD